MDIELETEKNGLTAAEDICRARSQIQIIFVTGYNDRYAQRVLLSRVNLVGYLESQNHTVVIHTDDAGENH